MLLAVLELSVHDDGVPVLVSCSATLPTVLSADDVSGGICKLAKDDRFGSVVISERGCAGLVPWKSVVTGGTESVLTDGSIKFLTGTACKCGPRKVPTDVCKGAGCY